VGDHRDGRVASGGSCCRRGRECGGDVRVIRDGLVVGLECGDDRIEHRLVPRVRLAAFDHPVERRMEGVAETRCVEFGGVAAGGPEAQEEGAVQGAGGSSDAHHQGHAGDLAEPGHVLRRSRLEFLGHRGGPPGEVEAVVGIADRPVEVREVVLLIGDGIPPSAEPVDQLCRRDPCTHRHIPHRSPAVSTGASQSRSMSSSALSSVRVQPAMSRLVM
jgi:hypothetical protein